MEAAYLDRSWPWTLPQPKAKSWEGKNTRVLRQGPSKVDAWYAHPAAMLDKYPLSTQIWEERDKHAKLPDTLTFATIRPLYNKLPAPKPAHSFKYKDEWKSLTIEAMATFYEDVVLHQVGQMRLSAWWADASLGKCVSRRRCVSSVGAALTMWFDVNSTGTLPDAIEIGLLSTKVGRFEKVFCLCFKDEPGQTFTNMPPHIEVLDLARLMSFETFTKVLASVRTTGFIAVLAEWVKQIAALDLPDVKWFDAVTTIDCDSLWQMKAMPPSMVCGHAAATLEVNPVSRLNTDMPKRLNALTFEYCSAPRDYLKIATPMRWPRGSPVLESLVRRIRPMVDMDAGIWCGGSDFEVVMNTMWDSYNNWGLRKAFNKPQVHTPVPYFAWEKPLKAGSAKNPKWGLGAIVSPPTICVNALWQTSKHDFGPGARNKSSWKRGSLVLALANHTKTLCANCDIAVRPRIMEWFGVWLTNVAAFFDEELLVRVLQTNSEPGTVLCAQLEALKARVTMRRLIFAKVSHQMMMLAGVEEIEMHNIGGFASKELRRISVKALIDDPPPSQFSNKRVVALALLKHASSLALDYSAERALVGVINGSGVESQSSIDAMLAQITTWRGRS